MPSHGARVGGGRVTFLPFSLKVKWVTWKNKKLLFIFKSLCFSFQHVTLNSNCLWKKNTGISRKGMVLSFSYLSSDRTTPFPANLPPPLPHPRANFKAMIHQTAVRHSELWWLLQNRFVHKMDSALLFLKKSPEW